MRRHCRTQSLTKVFAVLAPHNYVLCIMLKTLRKTHRIIPTLTLTSLISLSAQAGSYIIETGVGTRGTSATNSTGHTMQNPLLQSERIPFKTSDLTLNNGSLIKFAFTNYLRNIEPYTKVSESAMSVQEWILRNKQILSDQIDNSNWSFKENKVNAQNKKEINHKITFQFNEDTYTIVMIQKAEETPEQVRKNLTYALAFLIKKQGAPQEIGDIELELSKNIFRSYEKKIYN